MGFDPNRPFKKRKTDFIFVAAGLLMAVLLLLWAFLGWINGKSWDFWWIRGSIYSAVSSHKDIWLPWMQSNDQ